MASRRPVPATGRIIARVIPVGPNPPGPHSSTVRLRRLPDRVAATAPDRRRRGVPRPAGSRPARERPAGPQRPLDVPDGRPGRRPRRRRRPVPTRSRSRAGSRAGSIRRRSSRPMRRASSAGSSGSSATTSGTRSSGCRRSRSTTRGCRRSGSRCTTGSSPGTGGPVTRGWAGGRSTATRGGSARRLDDVHARLTTPAGDAATAMRRVRREPLRFRSEPRTGGLRGRRRARSASTSRAATSTRRT